MAEHLLSSNFKILKLIKQIFLFGIQNIYVIQHNQLISYLPTRAYNTNNY